MRADGPQRVDGLADGVDERVCRQRQGNHQRFHHGMREHRLRDRRCGRFEVAFAFARRRRRLRAAFADELAGSVLGDEVDDDRERCSEPDVGRDKPSRAPSDGCVRAHLRHCASLAPHREPGKPRRLSGERVDEAQHGDADRSDERQIHANPFAFALGLREEEADADGNDEQRERRERRHPPHAGPEVAAFFRHEKSLDRSDPELGEVREAEHANDAGDKEDRHQRHCDHVVQPDEVACCDRGGVEIIAAARRREVATVLAQPAHRRHAAAVENRVAEHVGGAVRRLLPLRLGRPQFMTKRYRLPCYRSDLRSLGALVFRQEQAAEKGGEVTAARDRGHVIDAREQARPRRNCAGCRRVRLVVNRRRSLGRLRGGDLVANTLLFVREILEYAEAHRRAADSAARDRNSERRRVVGDVELAAARDDARLFILGDLGGYVRVHGLVIGSNANPSDPCRDPVAQESPSGRTAGLRCSSSRTSHRP